MASNSLHAIYCWQISWYRGNDRPHVSFVRWETGRRYAPSRASWKRLIDVIQKDMDGPRNLDFRLWEDGWTLYLPIERIERTPLETTVKLVAGRRLCPICKRYYYPKKSTDLTLVQDKGT